MARKSGFKTDLHGRRSKNQYGEYSGSRCQSCAIAGRTARANYHPGFAKDTEEEAAAVKQAIGDAPFLLVTSASHLPRAMIFFSRKG